MDKLEKEAKEEEARKLKEFENYKSRAINEVRNRQAAELSSRNDMGAEESKRVSEIDFLVEDTCSVCLANVWAFLNITAQTAQHATESIPSIVASE